MFKLSFEAVKINFIFFLLPQRATRQRRLLGKPDFAGERVERGGAGQHPEGRTLRGLHEEVGRVSQNQAQGATRRSGESSRISLRYRQGTFFKNTHFINALSWGLGGG